MSKTKTPAKKARPKATLKATKPAKDQCAKGGAHEWEQEDGGIFCKKCHEAKPAAKGKTAPAAKPTTKPAKPEPSKNDNLLGEHYVHRIERVLFQQSKLDGDLWELKHAYGAKQFLFVDCNLTADVLAAIGECKSVEQMHVVGQQ
jgi:hypothetical protein